MAFDCDITKITELKAALPAAAAAAEKTPDAAHKGALAQIVYELGLLTTDQALLTQAHNIWRQIGDLENVDLAEKAMVLIQIK